MSEYGLTPQGPNIKRLDVILDEMHEQLSKAWGVNTKQNPQSFINHLLTNLADRLAELWEFGEDVYYSQYPSTAEGVSLDNAAQYGGSLRETGAKSYYPMHCTGVDARSWLPAQRLHRIQTRKPICPSWKKRKSPVTRSTRRRSRWYPLRPAASTR